MKAFFKYTVTGHFSVCSPAIVNSFLFRVSKMRDYTSLITYVFLVRLCMLEDPVLHRSTQILLTLCLYHCPSFCVPLLLSTYPWDPMLLALVCMQHREPEVPGNVQLPREGFVNDRLAQERERPAPLLWIGISSGSWCIYFRALRDQAVAVSCGTLPEITSLLDFAPFPSLFLLLLYWFLPRAFP